MIGTVRRGLGWAATVAASATFLSMPGTAVAIDSMVVQADGKIVLSGVVPQRHRACHLVRGETRCRSVAVGGSALVRFDRDGSLDADFGVDGAVVDFRQASESPIASEPGGGLLVARSVGDDLGLLRFMPDGSPDWNFGEEGIAIRPGGQAGRESPAAIALRPDRSIAVATRGDWPTIKGPFYTSAATAIFAADGSSSEETSRIVPEDFWPAPGASHVRARDLLALQDGSLIVAGVTEGWPLDLALLARVVPGAGSPFDRAFGNGAGLVSFPPPGPADTPTNRLGEASAIAIDDGKLVVAGGAFGSRLLVARFDGEGVLDSSFGSGGIAFPATARMTGASASAVALQPDGKIVLAGTAHEPCSAEPTRGCWIPFVARLESDGSLDTGFGREGFAQLYVPDRKLRYRPGHEGIDVSAMGPYPQGGDIDLATLPDGKLLLSETPSRRGSEFLLARFDGDGHLDPNFGEGGMATATACPGSVAERRRSGCLSSVAVGLRVSGLTSRRPRGWLRVTVDNPLDPVATIRLLLPGALRARPDATEKVRVVAVPRRKPDANVSESSIAIPWLGVRGLHVGIRPGLLRAVEQIKPGHKLVFRVEVKLKDGTQRTFRIVQSG